MSIEKSEFRNSRRTIVPRAKIRQQWPPQVNLSTSSSYPLHVACRLMLCGTTHGDPYDLWDKAPSKDCEAFQSVAAFPRHPLCMSSRHQPPAVAAAVETLSVTNLHFVISLSHPNQSGQISHGTIKSVFVVAISRFIVTRKWRLYGWSDPP